MPRVSRAREDATSVGGAEHWNDLQTKALCMAWYHVSANPAGKGTSQTKDELFEGVVVAYHCFYKKLGGVPPKPRKGVISKVRTGKACRTKWQTMNTCVTKFLSCDVLSSHTLRKSGATPKDFRADALEYYIKRHHHEFKFESAYDYLKDKPRWLRDAAKHKQDGKVSKKTRSTPLKEVETLRASDSEEEVVGDKPPGQKRARRLEKELVVINAAVAKKEAAIAKYIATFTNRAKSHKLSMVVEAERQRVEQEKLDDEVMRMDMSQLDDQKLPYWQQRIRDIYERQAARVAQKAAEVVAEATAREVAREAEMVAEQESQRREEEGVNEALLASERASATQGATPDAVEGEGDEEDTTLVPLVDLTEDVAHPYVNDTSEMARFTKMCEDMANAIDEKNGPEETSQPWLGVDEEWVQRTPEVSDAEAN